MKNEVNNGFEVVCYTISIHIALAFSLRLLYFRSKFLSYQNKIGWASLIQLDLKRVRKTAENSKHFWLELFEPKVRSLVQLGFNFQTGRVRVHPGSKNSRKFKKFQRFESKFSMREILLFNF